MLHCPHCSSPIAAEGVACARCGYESATAPEYVWLYAGGAAFILVGFALGAAGVLLEGRHPEHWSRVYGGWFPLVPWPRSHPWLAFIVLGIAFTLGGLGVTRRRLVAIVALVALSAYEVFWTALAALGMRGPEGARAHAAVLILPAILLLALSLRMSLAFARTPARRSGDLP